MRLVPRSLFGRNVLSLMVLFASGLGVGALSLYERSQMPEASRVAELVARQMVLAADDQQPVPGSGLAMLPEAQARPPPMRRGRSLAARRFVAELRLRLPQALDVRWDPADGGTAWVQLQRGAETYWLVEHGVAPEVLVPARRAGFLALVCLLSLAGAVLIQRRLNRQLTALAEAARRVGSSQRMEPLDESGPEELALVTRAFNHMTAALAKADAERALLLAGVSHDLRTPLAKMHLAIEMLRDCADPDLVQSMRRSAAEMQSVTEQFLYYARVQDSSERVHAELNELVQESVERHCGGGRAITLHRSASCCARVHRESLVRALDNLLENALRYSDGDVEVAVRPGSRCVTLSVLDRGPGIPPAEVDTLRQPFTRGAASAGKSGTGLGLAIVDRIAAAHGARFELLPRAGGGTEARLELPLIMGEMPSARTQASARAR